MNVAGETPIKWGFFNIFDKKNLKNGRIRKNKAESVFSTSSETNRGTGWGVGG